MKTLILYKSKHGTTELYVNHLAKNIEDCTIKKVEDFDPNDLNGYRYIIIGSPTYMGQIQARDFLIKNWDVLKDKKIFLFAVGIQNPNNDSSKISYEQIPEHIREGIEYTKIKGKLDFSKLNLLEKMIVKLVKTPEEKTLDTDSLKPVIDFVSKED